MPTEKNIESPEKLWEYFLAFVEHEKENPMIKREYVGKEGDKVDTKLQVPITFTGFEVYLAMEDIIDDLGHYASNRDGRYAEYVPIITRIRGFCFSQNFKGAAVGLFNANLIARKLGLMDKTQTEHRITKIEIVEKKRED